MAPIVLLAMIAKSLLLQAAARPISAPIAARMGCQPFARMQRSIGSLGSQAAAMARAGTVSHNVNGNFFVRIAPVHRRPEAENVAAGFLTCAETIRQWDESGGHRANLQMSLGARRVGIASVAKPLSPDRRFWAMAITD